jgi:hypothetical protein
VTTWPHCATRLTTPARRAPAGAAITGAVVAPAANATAAAAAPQQPGGPLDFLDRVLGPAGDVVDGVL